MQFVPHTLIVITLLSATTVGCNRSGTAPPSDAKQRIPKNETFSVEIPDGWTAARTNTAKTKVFLVTGIEGGQPPQGMVKIDVGLPVAPTAKKTAEFFSSQGTEESVIEPAALDGVDGFEVQADGTGLERPQRVLVVLKDDRLYLLMAASETTVDVVPVYEQLKSSWKWRDNASP